MIHSSPQALSLIGSLRYFGLGVAFWALLLARSVAQDSGAGAKEEGGDAQVDGKDAKKAGPAPTFEELKAKFESELDKEAFERLPTIEAFGAIRRPEAAEFLAGLFAKESNGGVGLTIARTLGRMGTEDAVKALIQKGMPYFIDPQPPAGAPAQQANLLKEERKGLLDNMEAALTSRLEPKAEEWLVKNGLTPLVRKDEQALGIVLKAIAGLRAKSRITVLLSEMSKLTLPAAQVSVLDTLRDSPEKDEKVAGAALQLLKSTNLDVQTAAYDLLATLPGGKHRAQLISGLKHKSWEIRAICIDGLSRAQDKDVAKYAGAALKDPDPKVRLAAVEALFDRGGPEVIEPLFKALETTDGRVQDDITDALTRLTGKSFGPISIQWESWWAQAKSTYKKTTPLTIEELAAVKEADSKKVTLAMPLYFGLRILSNRTAFLVDCSESMNEEYVPAQPIATPEASGKTVVVKKGEDDGGEAVEGDTARAKPKAQRKQKGAASRLDVAKRELVDVLSKLTDGQSLNLFRFNSLITDFSAVALADSKGNAEGTARTMPRLDARVRALAKTFVMESKGEGLTNLLSALRQALEYADLDTIYLLSDGAPTFGVTNHEEFLRELRRLNRRRRVKINTISFHPLPVERELLRTLALQNHGLYVER